MKKVLLMTAAVMFSLSISAQFKSDAVVDMKSIASEAFQTSAAVEIKKAPRRSADNGVLYRRPPGTLFMSWSKEGSGWYQSFLFAPPLTEMVFPNVSTAEGDPIWSIGENEYDADENGDFNFGTLGVQNPYVGAEGGVSYYYLPTLTIGEASFTLAGVGSGKNAAYDTYGSGIVVDSLRSVSLYDPHNGTLYGWGAMSPIPYLYGSGTLNGTQNPCVGITQDYEKPAAPLLIQDIFLTCYSDLEDPLPDGKKLTVTLVEIDEDGNETDNILGEMTATTESLLGWEHDRSGQYFTDEMGWQGELVFEHKTTDAFGQETLEPIIVNTPFRLYLTGLDQEGIDVGFGATYLADSDDKSYDTSFLVRDSETGQVGSRHYTSAALSLAISFSAMFDVAMLQDSDEGIYTAPVEGGTVTRANNTDYDAAYVYTAYPWTDDQANDNYFLYVEYADGDEEWIETEVYTGYWDQTPENSTRYYAVNLIGMEAQALPEGVEGRSATVYVYGPAAEVSFVVNQGKVGDDNPDGISTINENNKVAGKTFNLAGQQVNAQYKGIIVENGKKVIR